MVKKTFNQIQAERKALETTVEPVLLEPVLLEPSVGTIITDNIVEMVKIKIKQDKLDDQKTKKRDYQREYMRKYKKDVVLTEDEKLKKKVRRTLGKIDKDKLKTIIADLLGEK